VAIVNSVATLTAEGVQLIQRIGVVILTATPQTVTVPASGSISPAVTRGYARCKIYNQSVAISVTAIQLNATDGTNTVTVDEWAPQAALAITATAYCDITFDFIFDTLPSATAGGATGTLIFGGATSFNFLVFTSGAGGTAAGDFELAVDP
jgi:hypothetical protein